MKRFYYSAPTKVTECYHCGETRTCEVMVSDPEPETGYVDEYAVCEACKSWWPNKLRQTPRGAQADKE